nr:hypothetical protein [Tanacetum cinerariifolium]
MDDRIDKLVDQLLTLVDIVSKKVVTPATVKAVEESCVTCGCTHAYYNCDATSSNQSSICTATGTYNQVASQNRPSNHMAPSGFAPVQNSQNRYNQNQGQGNNFHAIPRRRNKRRTPNVVEPKLRTIVEVASMAERIIEELLQAPTEGYGEAIVIPEINADHFEIKTNLLQLVQANPYHGFERENPHTHINNFKRITSTLKFKDVPNDDLVNKFVNQFFPPSKTTHLKNEISRFTQRFEETFGEAWEPFKEMLRACPHHGFTELAQIDTFYNCLNDNDQDSLNASTSGNSLSKTTREALNIIKNKLKVRYSRNKPNISRMNTTSRENTSKTNDKLADQISTLVDIFAKKVITPTPVKAVEESCVTCGGNHAYYNCDATNNNQSSVCVATGTCNQVAPQNRASNYMAPPDFAPVQNNSQNRFNQNQGQGNNFNRGNNFHNNQPFQVPNQRFQNQPFQVPNNQVQQGFSNEFSSYKKANDQMMRNMQSKINSLKGEFKNEIKNTMKTQQTVLMNQQNAFQNNLQNMLSGFFQNQSLTLGTILEINADHFEIKTNLLQLVQANPYHGFERENPRTHINNFKRITSTLKFRDVPNDVIKLMMFPYSLEGTTRVLYNKEHLNSILTWEDIVNKFVNQFFPPSKATHLKNEISHFT